MNHSIYNADRTTHLKIVVVALAIAIAASLAISHFKSDTASGSTAAVVKAGKPIAVTSSAVTFTR